MRIVYGIVIAILCTALVIGVQKWRGPILPALSVEPMPLELRIVASGEVRYQTLARIGSEITGTVIARHVREGDQVSKGDLLIELNPEELQSRLAQAQTLLQQLREVSRPQAQAALVEARDNLRQASREARRRETLAKQGMIPIEQAEQAQRLELNAKTALTRAQLSVDSLAADSTEERLLQQRIVSAEAELAKTRIYAPFAGRVQTRNVEPGDLVQPSKTLLEIARSDGFDRDGMASDGLEVVVALDEKNFAPLKLQQPVQLIADAWPEQVVPGVVSFIAPAVDSGRGTIDVHISLLEDNNKQHNRFLQGMTVSANIIAAERESTLVLPNDYLLFNSAGQAQVLRWHDGEVSAQDVQLGLRNMTHSEILAGLTEGDVVVHAGKATDGQRARVRFEQAQYVIR
ncbi:efflux RND transporter periplasmic adaptor subunit [Pseudomonas sp. C27(2019)]|uniref:efflux RND transporter periplasmic adaptor subunit n=1 Tax=Pseudomonas sp. C27(2019) TaxID=2604941 RepID=UPI001248A330|nr:efflux RND transporter periplasmic adaptor subunit [Pseudomonas sp. C27(2019)]QEY58587.1 efflux RND transporter periplasmic adaptor subunit [Pseudomonas sp. C27(2019)]